MQRSRGVRDDGLQQGLVILVRHASLRERNVVAWCEAGHPHRFPKRAPKQCPAERVKPLHHAFCLQLLGYVLSAGLIEQETAVSEIAIVGEDVIGASLPYRLRNFRPSAIK